MASAWARGASGNNDSATYSRRSIHFSLARGLWNRKAGSGVYRFAKDPYCAPDAAPPASEVVVLFAIALVVLLI